MKKLSKEKLKELEVLTDQANLIIFEEKMRGEDIRLILVPVINELLNITTVPNHNINIYMKVKIILRLNTVNLHIMLVEDYHII